MALRGSFLHHLAWLGGKPSVTRAAPELRSTLLPASSATVRLLIDPAENPPGNPINPADAASEFSTTAASTTLHLAHFQLLRILATTTAKNRTTGTTPLGFRATSTASTRHTLARRITTTATVIVPPTTFLLLHPRQQQRTGYPFAATLTTKTIGVLGRPRFQRHTFSTTTAETKIMPGTHKEKVCLIGSGNWGSAIAKIVGRNVSENHDYDTEVRMWVYEEIVQGQRLTEIINTKHENVRYLPDVILPDNVVAVPDLLDAVQDSTLLIFVIPHQFVKGVCEQLKGKIHPRARAISLIKGVDISKGGLHLISDLIRENLDIDVSVLMGANIASEVAMDNFCESTIGCTNTENGKAFWNVFHTPYFRVAIVDDVAGVELCGALKNVVAIGAGLIDGLKMGENTKAAIIRIGLMEMRKFAKTFYAGVKDETFFESCGIADVITTCFGGRNRRVAEARVRTGKSFDTLEKEMLNGQKLQGTLTAKEVYEILSAKNLTDSFPFFTAIYRVCYEGLAPRALVDNI